MILNRENRQKRTNETKANERNKSERKKQKRTKKSKKINMSVTFEIDERKWYLLVGKNRLRLLDENPGLSKIVFNRNQKKPLRQGGMGMPVILYGRGGTDFKKIRKEILDQVNASLEYDSRREQRTSNRRFRRNVDRWYDAEAELEKKQQSLNMNSKATNEVVSKTNSRFVGLELHDETTEEEIQSRKAKMEAMEAQKVADQKKAQASFEKKNKNFTKSFAALVKSAVPLTSIEAPKAKITVQSPKPTIAVEAPRQNHLITGSWGDMDSDDEDW